MAARAAKEAATAERVSAELAADQLDEDEIMATDNFCITNAVSATNVKFAIEKDVMTIIPTPGVYQKCNRVLWSVKLFYAGKQRGFGSFETILIANCQLCMCDCT